MIEDKGVEAGPHDEDASPAEGPEPPGSHEGDGTAGGEDFRAPAGFARSLLPNTDDYMVAILAPLHDRMFSMMPGDSALARDAVAQVNELLQEQMASIVASAPAFSRPPFGLRGLEAPVLNPATQEMLKKLSEQQASAMEGLRKSLGHLFDPALRGFNQSLLPPNLKEHGDEITASHVRQFVEQEGIPLHLVPRGRTALRLLRAPDRAGRRRVLGDCYNTLMEDCAAVLERADHDAVAGEVAFALDGLGAMRAGHPRSAQAMFTVTLDTLIYRFYPDREARKVITNRKKGTEVPGEIDEMGVREAFVWLPIWNAHEEFWKHMGDQVPHYYSRHASVHGVSSRQFSKRNCIQVLMLVTSLIGYADRIAREAT